MVAASAVSLIAVTIVAVLVMTPTQSVAASAIAPLDAYSVFGTSSSGTENMPTTLASQQPADAEIRSQPTDVPGVFVWAVAGDGRLCVAESSSAGDGSEACAPAASLSGSGDLLFTASAQGTPSTSAGEVDLVCGLAPDGVRAVTFILSDGTSEQASVLDNGFQLQVDRTIRITSVSWDTAAGAVRSQVVGAP